MKLRIKENYDCMLEFDIVPNLHLSYVNLNIEEDWKFNKDDFILPNKANASVLSDLQNQINSKMKKYLIPTLENCLYKHNYHLQLNSKGEKYSSGSNLKSNNYLSYSCYFTVIPNYFNVDCSDFVTSSIGNFKLRIANHISKQELDSITKLDNVKIFIQNIDDLYASKFTKCTENVLVAYTDFLNTLATYPERIENFTDILPEHIQALKKWQKQGF